MQVQRQPSPEAQGQAREAGGKGPMFLDFVTSPGSTTPFSTDTFQL